MADESDTRPASGHPCIYWTGTNCGASDIYAIEDISCYNAGNCDGFGTCRGCSKYNQGGLKIGSSDGDGGYSQTPMNLQLYNIRAQVKPCCFWDADPVQLVQLSGPSRTKNTACEILEIDDPDSEDPLNPSKITVLSVLSGDTSLFPSAASLLATKDGAPSFTVSYSDKELTYFKDYSGIPAGVTDIENYKLSMVTRETTPHFLSKTDTEEPDPEFNTERTSCTLDAAAPWQAAFTDENPSAYGCNGAKSECPYYSGPKFTELVDSKMDTGHRISAKQVLELRFHSNDWASLANPREQYELAFTNPDIWAWVSTSTENTIPDANSGKVVGHLPGSGRKDADGNPFVQKVSIEDLTADTPVFIVGAPVPVTTGTAVQEGGVPSFPDLVRELKGAAAGMEILWPRKTTRAKPYVRKTFSPEEMNMWISVQANSSRDIVAVNLTKHPQDGDTDTEFVSKMRQLYPEDVVFPIESGLPALTFPVPLILDGNRETINHIRIFLETGLDVDGSMLTADVFVRHVFYHAEVAQTRFEDKYGHTAIDPWINHFNEIEIKAKFLHLTNNTKVHDVLWNTFATNGKITLYATEEIAEASSAGEEATVTWEQIGCGAVVVTFEDPKVNRVYPWRAWGDAVRGEKLYVKIDRSNNNDLEPGEPTEIELELLFASSKGTAIPGNVAVFGLPAGERIRTLDHDSDVINVKYAYTEYKEGPITQKDQDELLLKFPSDITKVIENSVYENEFDDNSMTVGGTFLKVGEWSSQTSGPDVFIYRKIYSCDQVIGNCYTESALENEELAQTVFFAGGVGEENVKGPRELQKVCRDKFEEEYTGLFFEDGVEVTFAEVVRRLSQIYLLEGSQHYNVIFSDEDGRPIGSKTVGFLTQSAVVQNRDVEIKYSWGAEMRHYPTIPRMLVHAIFHEPTFSTRDRLIKKIYEYEPFCGDHSETTIGRTGFTAFDLQIDEQGALWYPYKSCLLPRYHVGGDEWFGPYHYKDTIEGFLEGKRRNYWERMRWFDEYTPSTLNLWGQIGCFFSEYTTTANAHGNVVFTGYTKIRSDHAFGPYATDRESLRVSRHWEKRNLTINEETLKQEDDGLTVSISDEFAAILFDEDGDLIEGQEVQTPVWVHINDGFSVVRVASERINHPFSRYLLSDVGNYSHSESFQEERLPLDEVFEDRDFTSASQRSEDGSKVYIPQATTANTDTGELEVSDGSDLRWVFLNADQTWAWMAQPPAPLRAQTKESDEGNPNASPTAQITGLTLSPVGPTFFKKNKRSATHAEEKKHIIKYTPHEFDEDGNIAAPATLSMDGGPEWNISQTDGKIYVLAGSPYLAEEHEGEEYEFVLHGHSVGGAGLLADSRGLQYYEISDTKYSTYAGVNITTVYDINELPYKTENISQISRLSDTFESLEDFVTEYGTDDLEPHTLSLDFLGHYYVEEVIIDWKYGGAFDVPVVEITGSVKDVGIASGPSAVTTAEELSSPTTYIDAGANGEGSERQTFIIRQRLFNLHINMGARKKDRKASIVGIQVRIRNPREVEESVFIYEPRAQVSTANVGTHKPSDLEFYFQRETPDFAKNYGNHMLDSVQDDGTTGLVPEVEIKYTGRQIKDIVPMFNFTGFADSFYPYKNIDLTEIPNYVEETSPAGQTLRYIDAAVSTSSKGWTMKTSRHYADPSASAFSTDTGPEGTPNVNEVAVDVYAAPNVLSGNKPNEELQGFLYDSAGGLLGDRYAHYDSFWHPEEREFFLTAGIDLTQAQWNWELVLSSTVASIERVYRHESYGCNVASTSEDLDGKVHTISNWHAKGVFHYLCDPRYSWACLAVVINKCNEVMFGDYGKSAYLSNNIVDRFTYKFQFPPGESQLYIDAGLFNQNEIGGFIGGTGGISASHASAPFPNMSQLQQKYQSELYITGKNKYQ